MNNTEIIDLIDSVVSHWYERTACEYEKDETTDEFINLSLGLPATGAVRELEDELSKWDSDEVKLAVIGALDEWALSVKRQADDEEARFKQYEAILD